MQNNLPIRIFLSFLLLASHAQNASAAEDAVENVAPESSLPPELQENAPIEIKFREEDLPMESVTPIVDSPKAVLNKKIKFESRFEFTAQYSWIVDEMFSNNSQFGFKASYHFNELNSAGILFQARTGGKTQYADQFENFSAQLKFDRAPSPSTMLGLTFDQKFYYGKVSIGKEKVIPVVTESNYMVGMQKQGSKQMPVASIGLTQRFFVLPNVSMGISYKALFQQLYDPTSVNVREVEPVPEEGSFQKKIQSSQVLGLSTSYLF